MYVRLLYGPKAGETEFMLTPVARQLIAQGRAADPRDDARELVDMVTSQRLIVPAARAAKGKKSE